MAMRDKSKRAPLALALAVMLATSAVAASNVNTARRTSTGRSSCSAEAPA